VKENHYTHIEFMPLSEHPADCSWGYQVTGFYSPTSRYGTAQDLQYLVNECHKAGIGVIMDFVPVHFAMDYYSLSRFDGTPLYEYPEREKGYSEWGSCNFNYYRGETRSFLQSAAAYWLDVYHCDGVRMDAISNVIYWQGNQDRGVNTGALDFIKEMNAGLQSLYPTAMLIAEDSSAFPKVTAPVSYDGLGFDYKWDMGWMNDTLDFFKLAPWERSANYHKLTFSMMYFYNELFILPFSHDEVVHGKATIMQKMWGEYEQKFSQCRLLYLYMFSHPGKKLNFMGNEWGQLREWDETREQDWSLLEYPNHDAFHRYMVDLNKLYVKYDALYDEEYNPQRFQWLQVHGEEHCVYIYQRKGKEKSLVVAMNMTDVPREDYQFAADEDLVIKEIFNSDTDYYGGTTPMPKRRNRIKAVDGMMTISLAPFSGKIYEVCQPTKKKPAKKLSANTDQ
jgi:1,4-alpha-glucan branching enzyme